MEAIASADGSSHQRDPRRARSNVHSDKRQERRDRRQQVTGRGLLEPVRGDLEREPAHERRAHAETQLSQPCVRREAGGDEPEQHEHVPPDDDAERPPERPEGKAERPGRRIELRLGDRAERVGVTPRVSPFLDLVAGKPQAIGGLEVIPCRRLAVARLAAGEEVGVGMAQRRGRCQQRRRRAEQRR